MMATGLWQDTVYSACCFMGARCKAQRLRRNIDEIAQWPALHCHRTHAADEWQPYLQDGQRVFPSKEEAEYTASLELQSLLPGKPPAWGWRSSTCPVSPLWKSQAGGNIGCRLIPGRGQWHLQLSLWGCDQLTRKRGQGHLIGHAWWMSSWKTSGTRPPQPSPPSYQMELSVCSRPQLRPVLLASTLCGAHHAAPGGGPSGVDRMCFGLRLRASGQVRRVLAAVAALPPTVGAVIPYWSQEAVVAAFRSL